jgi:hypothetical protein
MSAAAGTAINEYLEGQVTLGFQTGRATEQGMKEAIRTRLRERGFSDEDINTAIANTDFVQQAVNLGSHTRTDEAQAMADNVVSSGGEVAAGRDARAAAHTREQVQEHRESALRRIGIESGLLTGIADEERRAVLDTLAGDANDPRTQIRRQLLAAEGLREAGQEEAAQRVIASLSGRYDEAMISSERRQLRGNIARGDVQRSTLAGLGRALEGKSPEEIAETMRLSGEEAERAASGEVHRGMIGMVGEEAAGILRREGFAAMQEFVQAGGGRMGEGMRRRIVEGQVSREDLETQATNRAQAGIAQNVVAGGLTQLAELTGMEAFEEAAAFVQGGVTPEGREGATPAGPQTFETAVGTFSEASTRLLRAANAMEGSSSYSSVTNVASSAFNATGPAALSPISGIISLVNGINAFSGD